MMLSGTHDCDDMFYYTSGLKKCVDDTGKIQIEMRLDKKYCKIHEKILQYHVLYKIAKHKNIMTKASAHHEQMKNFMRSEVRMSGIEDRQL